MSLSFSVTDIHKALYDEAKLLGKCASMLSVSNLHIDPTVREKIKVCISDIEYINDSFSLIRRETVITSRKQTHNTEEMEKCLSNFKKVADSLLPDIFKYPHLGFVHEELSAIISLVEQRIAILKAKSK